jgi:cyanate permease
MTDWYHGEDFGAIMGKQWSIAAVVGGMAPLLVGVLRDATGSYTIPIAGLIGASFVAVAVTLLAGGIEATTSPVDGRV